MKLPINSRIFTTRLTLCHCLTRRFARMVFLVIQFCRNGLVDELLLQGIGRCDGKLLQNGCDVAAKQIESVGHDTCWAVAVVIARIGRTVVHVVHPAVAICRVQSVQLVA